MKGDATKSENRFKELGVMHLDEGFLAYEVSKDRSGDWRFASLSDVVRREFSWSGLHPVTALNLASYLRFRLSKRDDPIHAMRKRFVYELGVGMIEAIGYVLPRSLSDRPVLIPKQVWEHGELDWNRAEVTGAGFTFTYVRIVMPYESALFKGKGFDIEPMPELGPFALPELQRSALGIAAQSASEPPLPKGKPGRPSQKEAIIQAFHEIDKDPSWQHKPLANAVRVRAQEILGKSDDDGLSQKTIMGHVKPLWDEFRERKT
jgi:hypothetical protein